MDHEICVLLTKWRNVLYFQVSELSSKIGIHDKLMQNTAKPYICAHSWPHCAFSVKWVTQTHMTIPLLYFITKINSLAPGRCGKNFKNIIFKTVIWSSSWSTRYEIVRKWMSKNLTNEKSTLLQVMAWCHQATSHYLSQRWPRSMLPYGITRPQWVKTTTQISWKHSQHLNKNIVETSMVSISIVMS